MTTTTTTLNTAILNSNKILVRLQTINELNHACLWADETRCESGNPVPPKRGLIDQKLFEISIKNKATSKNKRKKFLAEVRSDLMEFVLENTEGKKRLFCREGKLEWYVECLIEIMENYY